MKKRAQLSLIFVIGILLLSAFLVSFGFTDTAPRIEQTFEFESSDVSEYVQACLDKELLSGLTLIGKQGGYYTPQFFEPFKSFNVGLYANVNYLIVPSTETIQNELSSYIRDSIVECVDFSIFPGLDIQSENPMITTTITENDVSALLYFPITITKGSSITTLDSFSSTNDIRFKHMYDVVETFMREQQSDLDSIHFGYLAELAYENDFFFEIIKRDKNTIIYSLQFNSELLYNEPYIYNFVARYDWE